MNNTISTKLKQQQWTILSVAILCIGVIYRIDIWWVNRGLFIDEANLARNIFERDWLQLLQPLSYEQYAPPLFLWVQKALTNFFGYSEKVFRLYPLVSGILSLLLLFNVLKIWLSEKVHWYPLVLFATGAIYLRYATECKQYMPDTMIALSLLWLSLKVNIKKILPFRFAVIWIIVGSLAIWSSMSSVFILAGVGMYYASQLLHTDIPVRRWTALIFVGILWLVQFAGYYFAMLSTQIESGYLQNYHQWYFLDAMPAGWSGFKNHNWLLIKGLVEQLGGKLAVSLVAHLFLTILGVMYAIRQRDKRIILLLIPGVLLLIASMIKSYSLVERLVLFYFPFWLIIIGIGLEYIMTKWPSWSKGLVLVIVIFTAIKANKISYITTKPLTLENMPVSLDFLLENKITAPHLYVSHLAVGGYKYYTEIHPNRMRWSALQGAKVLSWDVKWDSLFMGITETSGILFSSLGNDIKPVLQTAEEYKKITARSEQSDVKAYIISSK